MMPMFRILSSGVVRGIAFLYSAKTRGDRDAHHLKGAGLAPLSSGGATPLRRACFFPPRGMAPGLVYPRLPPVVRECPICFGHPVRVFLLLYRFALALRGEDQLGGEPFGHVLFAPRAAELDQPAHAERGASL